MPLTMSEIDFSAESGGRLGKPKRGSIEPIGVEPDGERTSGDKSFWDNIPAMDATMPSDGFYASLPILRDFTRVMDPGLFAPLPDGWLVGIADVVQSTKAIAENRYKAVNMAVAAEHEREVAILQRIGDGDDHRGAGHVDGLVAILGYGLGRLHHVGDADQPAVRQRRK